MHRLFVAIRPPSTIISQLLATMGGIENARWQDDEQLHLTLRFIGEVDRHQAEDVAAALGSVHHPRLALALAGVGQFEKRGRGAIWAGVAPQEGLKALHKKVDQACRRVGIPPDTRAYLPHITLARTGRAAGLADPFIERWAGLASPLFEVDSFRLYESRLGSEGASYTTIARYPLG
jgi:2'-5' RNA ligase